MDAKIQHDGSKPSRRGFTLVELLVVISIIALLMSILMPSLKAARDQAKKVVCLSNCKQLGIALQMYTDDWNDWFPQSVEPPRDALADNLDYYRSWYILLRQEKYVQDDITDRIVITDDPPTGMALCPNEPLGKGTWGPENSGGGVSRWFGTTYGINNYMAQIMYFGNPPRRSPIQKYYKRRTSVRKPAVRCLMADTVDFKANTANVALRHGKKNSANVLYTDGHVETNTLEELPILQRNVAPPNPEGVWQYEYFWGFGD